MNSLIKYLIREGLLSDVSKGTSQKAFDVSTAHEWLSQRARGEYEIKPYKDGISIKGTVIIKKSEYSGVPIRISAFNGTLALEACNNLTSQSLSDMFAPGFKGDKMDLIITDCPKIDSLDWIPSVLRSLSVAGCRSLRKLPQGKKVTGSVSLTQNGRRWKEDQVAGAFGTPQIIHCSIDNDGEEQMINEAFRVTQLSALSDQLKREGNNRPMASNKITVFNLSNAEMDQAGKDLSFYLYNKNDTQRGVLGNFNIRYDRISPSNVRTVHNPTEKDLKDLRIWSMLRREWVDGDFVNGIIMCADERGYQLVATLIYGSGTCWTNGSYYHKDPSIDELVTIISGNNQKGRNMRDSVTPSEVMSRIKMHIGEWKEITVIYLDRAAMADDDLNAADLVDQRGRAKNGVVLSHDLSALNRILDNNRMRLKENAKKLRAARDMRLGAVNTKVNEYIEFSQQTNQKIIVILELLSSGKKIAEYDQRMALRNLVEEMYEFNCLLFGRKQVEKYYSNFRLRDNPKITEHTGVVTMLSRAISQKYSQITHFDFEKMSGDESGKEFDKTIKDIEWYAKGLESVKQRLEKLLQRIQNLKIM